MWVMGASAKLYIISNFVNKKLIKIVNSTFQLFIIIHLESLIFSIKSGIFLVERGKGVTQRQLGNFWHLLSRSSMGFPTHSNVRRA